MNARPAPVLGLGGEACPHGIERNVPQRGEQMQLVHSFAAEPALPEMPGAPLARMAAPSIGPVHLGQGRAQSIGMLWNQDQMDVVRHQHPAPYRHAMRRAVLAQQVAIGGIVRSAKKIRCRPLPHWVT